MDITSLALAFGGWANIVHICCCASRLRMMILDKEAVDEEALKKNGVIGIKGLSDHYIQAIVGPKVEAVCFELLKEGRTMRKYHACGRRI